MQIPGRIILRSVIVVILCLIFFIHTISAEITGKLTVVIEPSEIASEAYWKLSRGEDTKWHASGEWVYQIPVGKNQIQFYLVPGWCKPPILTIEIKKGDNIANIEYTRNSCEIPEYNENIGCEEFLKKDIFTDKEVMFEFQKECNVIRDIKVNGFRNLEMVPFKIYMLKSTSITIDQSPPDMVYKNFIVASGNYDFENNLEVISITFSVEKSWIEENNIMSDSINLYGYSEGTWSNYPTEKIDEDSTYIYFTAYPATEQLGTMAVSGQSNKTSLSFSPIAVQVSNVSIATPFQESEESKDYGNVKILGFLLVITILSSFILSPKSPG